MDEDPAFSYHYHDVAPFKLECKELIFQGSHDIENSFTGLLNMLGLHIFFIESAILIRNAVYVFEKGFFDSAFYNVRSAVELARIVMYFSKYDEPKDSESYEKWRTGDRFPFDSRIKSDLKDTSSIYGEIYEAMPDFFEGQNEQLKRMQKYIHKQGYKTFYHVGPTNEELQAKRITRITSDFEKFTLGSLKEIALLRLCIDPFPLLLNDPKVMRRIHFQSMTTPFSDDFLKNVLGDDIVSRYRSTEFYKSQAEFFSGNPELSEVTMTLINNEYYDRGSWDSIKKDMKHIPLYERISVLIFNSSKKISYVYSIGGLHWVFSDVKSNRFKVGMSWSSETFNSVRSENVPYDNVFLTYLNVADEDFWVEHNSVLNEKEIKTLKSIAND